MLQGPSGLLRNCSTPPNFPLVVVQFVADMCQLLTRLDLSKESMLQ